MRAGANESRFSSEELLKIKIHFQGYQFMDLYLLILKSSETAWKMERNLVCNRGGISNGKRKDAYNVKTRDYPFGRKCFFHFPFKWCLSH